MVLRGYLRAVLRVDEQDGSVSDSHSGQSSTSEVITARAVDDVQLLIVPLHMERSSEDAVAVFLLHGEVVGHGVLLRDASATCDDATLEEQRFGEGGLTSPVTAKQGNVLDFLCLIVSH